LGDLVGYGPHPNQVIERLRDLDVVVVRGCWDEGIANDQGHCGCEFASQEDAELGELTYTWTELEVNEESRAYLRGLPFLMARRTAAGIIAFVHGSTASTAEDLSEETHDLFLLERASRVDCELLACGHTHIPFARRIHRVLEAEHSPVLETGATGLRTSRTLLRAKTLINCGSVGEPRHGGPEATYAVLNQATGAVAIRKVPYDVEATVGVVRE
jgi:predicted phosphodiesterase